MKERFLFNEKAPAARIRLRRGDTFLRRLRGLLFTRSLPEGEGLLLAPCNSVHMLGMLYALDIVYLDEAYRVIKIVPSLPPFGLSVCLKAAAALELPAGAAKRYDWKVGDCLRCEDGAEKTGE